ncbi:hypothetical protein, partial [Lactobacillus delbrueckii]|uniref:hypothetical protein n=1 Tax=Lactobacillus delbrueckii TaxID=1584 RepID=UPI0030D6DBB2
SDDLIFIDRHVRANKSDPVFAVGTISYADYSGINLGTIFGSQLSLLVSSSRVERIVKDEAIRRKLYGQSMHHMTGHGIQCQASRSFCKS